jgi:hypothetical protein
VNTSKRQIAVKINDIRHYQLQKKDKFEVFIEATKEVLVKHKQGVQKVRTKYFI